MNLQEDAEQLQELKKQIKREKRAEYHKSRYVKKSKVPKTVKQLATAAANKARAERKAKELQDLKTEIENYKQDILNWKAVVDKQSELIITLTTGGSL